jgi:hypothetical protein
VVELGQNDPGSDAVREADLTAIYTALAGNGRRIWGATVDPYTTGAWANADGSDQSVGRDQGVLNGWIKSDPAPLFGHFDIAPPVSLASPTTKWKAGYTADGVHANQTANLARQRAVGAVIQAALG